MTTYPVRCQLVENPHDGPPRSEDGSEYVGEFGVADMVDGNVVITLDSGVVVQDSACWWDEVKGREEEKD